MSIALEIIAYLCDQFDWNLYLNQANGNNEQICV